MSSFSIQMKPHVNAEIAAAFEARNKENFQLEFAHLERAHILGQNSTFLHVKVHCLMLIWGWKQRDVRESLGQLVRIAGALTKTALGFVPVGNTGGSKVSPFKTMSIPADLQALIQTANSSRSH